MENIRTLQFHEKALFNHAVDLIENAMHVNYPALREEFPRIVKNVFLCTETNSELPRGVAIVSNRSSFVDLRFLVVRSDLQCNGVGRSLIDFVEKWAIVNKSRSISLTDSTKNSKIHGWYERRGYVPDGIFSMVKTFNY